MNQPQREFLIKHIDKAHRAFVEKLKTQKPDAPSLNNYLVAAVLSGTIELQSLETIREHVRQKTLKLGRGDALIQAKSRYDDDDDDNGHKVSLTAGVVFVLPAEYVEARSAYEKALAAWQEEIDRAEGIKDTLMLKVQIGSAEVLTRLVEQVDDMADLQLVNSRLILTEAPSVKQISAKKGR